MVYVSTRGGAEKLDFSSILLNALPSDGGLMVPESYPNYSKDYLDRLREKPYKMVAFDILTKFMADIPTWDLEGIINKTYNKQNFKSDKITPLTEIMDGVYTQGLSEGPTLAFKDIALQLLGNLFEYQLQKNDDYLNILGSSSGDTVGAAEYAMLGKKNINIFMMTPFGKMSQFQTAQVYSLDEPNIFNIALTTVFDGCQDISKSIGKDKEFSKKYHIGAVNSYNWARVAAQVVYYFYGYLNMTLNSDQEVDFAVPTGNFGDILAGHIARQMGLPIRRLILATNENNVLDTFFKTGVYREWKNGDVIKTSSPSMDISKASNFERFLHDLFWRDASITKRFMEKFEREGVIDLSDTIFFKRAEKYGIFSGSAVHSERIKTIKKIYRSSGIIIDPHTANGVKVAMEYKQDNVPMICLETAKPVKFEDTIKEALGFAPERSEEYKDIENKKQKYTLMEPDIEKVKKYIEENAIKCLKF